MMFRSDLLSFGCVLLQLSAFATAVEFPLYTGRSTSGTWKNALAYEIFYYSTIKDAEGPVNQVDCAVEELTKSIFLDANGAGILEMTKADAERVEQDFAAVAPEEAWRPGGYGMSVSGGSGFGGMGPPPGLGASSTNATADSSGMVAPSLVSAGSSGTIREDQGNASLPTAQSRQFRSRSANKRDEMTVHELYHQQTERSLGQRGGLQYKIEVDLGLYIDGVYMKTFQDVLKLEGAAQLLVEEEGDALAQELQAFVLEQATSLVKPEVRTEVPDDDIVLSSLANSPFARYQEVIDLYFMSRQDVVYTCVFDLEGEPGWNPGLENRTLVGHSIQTEFEGQELEYSVFFEFFALRDAHGRIENEDQKMCFKNAVSSLFVPESIPMTLEEQEFALAMIQQEHEKDESKMYHPSNGTMEGGADSIFWDQKGAQVTIDLGNYVVGYQKGAMVTIDGEYVHSYEDYSDPTGLQAFVKGLEDPIAKRADIKHLFPVNGTSQLQAYFLPMMGSPHAMVSMKPQKDGTGIFPIMFMEQLMHCVNATDLERYKNFDRYGQFEEVVEEEEEPAGVNPNDVLDAIYVGGGNDAVIPVEVESPAETSGAAFHGGCFGVLMVLFALVSL